MTCVFWIVLGQRLDLEQQQPTNDEATAVQEPAGWMLFVLPCSTLVAYEIIFKKESSE